MRSSLVFGLMLTLMGLLGAGCGKVSAPVRLYFIGSPRFVAGNRPPLGQPDTLATRLYAALDTGNAGNLQRFKATVTYQPRRAPFAYPVAPAVFNYLTLAGTTEQLTYLDTVFAPGRRQLLYTQVFGTRTTAGSERWEFVVTDGNSSSSRSFTLAVRRPDSTLTYHDYVLNLNQNTGAARRFVQLRAGLALPASAVVPGTPSADNIAQQTLTDLVVAADGNSLAVPAAASLGSRWTGTRRATGLVLTPLKGDSALTTLRDTLSLRRQYVGTVLTRTSALAARQVYAFRTIDPKPSFGLIVVQAVPRGTTQGLRLRVVVAKQPL